jgi:hypothetical protein
LILNLGKESDKGVARTVGQEQGGYWLGWAGPFADSKRPVSEAKPVSSLGWVGFTKTRRAAFHEPSSRARRESGLCQATSFNGEFYDVFNTATSFKIK